MCECVRACFISTSSDDNVVFGNEFILIDFTVNTLFNVPHSFQIDTHTISIIYNIHI